MERKRFGRHSSQGEVPSPEVPGEVIVPAPGLKPEDIGELAKVAAEFLPGSKAHKWFKKTFENEEGKKNAKFYVGVATVGFIIGGAVVEHLRGYRDVGELKDKVKEATDKWVEERLPKLKNFRKEYDKKEPLRLKSIKEFMKKAPLYSQAEVSPVFLTHFDRDNKKRMVTFGIKYALPSDDFFIEYLAPNISEEDWNDLSMQREIEKRLSAQAEKQRRIVKGLLEESDDKVILKIADETIPVEVRDEIVKYESYSSDSVLDATFINPPGEPPLKPRKFRLFRRS